MKKAFTLIELIIVLTLFIIIVGFAGWSFIVGLRAWNSGQNRAEIRLDGTLAIEKMVRELSQASDITTADEDEIIFEADLDDDGTVETVTFNVSNNNLIRTVNAVATVLASNVQTFGLSYLDLNNSPWTLPQDPVDIRVITISLTMSNLDETFSLSSSTYVRNQQLVRQ